MKMLVKILMVCLLSGIGSTAMASPLLYANGGFNFAISLNNPGNVLPGNMTAVDFATANPDLVTNQTGIFVGGTTASYTFYDILNIGTTGWGYPDQDVFVFTNGGLTFTFNMVSLTNTSDPTFLNLTGYGTLTQTGGTSTYQPGSFIFTLTSSSSDVQATFLSQGTGRVPEPGLISLLGIGLLGMGIARRKWAAA